MALFIPLKVIPTMLASKINTQSEAAVSMDTVFQHTKKGGCSVERPLRTYNINKYKEI